MVGEDFVFENQDRQWSRQAAHYDDNFLDPYASGVDNPLWAALDGISDPAAKTVADLGCGTGPLLPYLASRFGRVVALDFSPTMLKRARDRIPADLAGKVRFVQSPMHELAGAVGPIDVAVSVNSLVMPDVRLIDQTLKSIWSCLHSESEFLGIVPSIDAIHYHTMLLQDQALEHGLAPREAEQFTARHAEHRLYNFAFGRFKFRGLRQKFWHPFEVEYRLARAGFRETSLAKVLYPWEESLEGSHELSRYPRSWDWFFRTIR